MKRAKGISSTAIPFLYDTSRKIACNSRQIRTPPDFRGTNSETSRDKADEPRGKQKGKISLTLNAKFKVVRRKIRSRDRYRVDARRFGVGHAEIHPFLVPRERGSSSEARRTSTTPALIELSRSLYQEMERAATSHHRL